MADQQNETHHQQTSLFYKIYKSFFILMGIYIFIEVMFFNMFCEFLIPPRYAPEWWEKISVDKVKSISISKIYDYDTYYLTVNKPIKIVDKNIIKLLFREMHMQRRVAYKQPAHPCPRKGFKVLFEFSEKLKIAFYVSFDVKSEWDGDKYVVINDYGVASFCSLKNISDNLRITNFVEAPSEELYGLFIKYVFSDNYVWVTGDIDTSDEPVSGGESPDEVINDHCKCIFKIYDAIFH